MKKYKKEINGKVEVKTLKDIVLSKDGNVVFNPTEEMVLADGWTEYVFQRFELPMEMQLQQAKGRKIREIERYDESSEVNDCIIVYQEQEIHYWASKDERNDLKSAVKDCISVGRETYRLDLRDKGLSIEIRCELLLQMLADLEVYAIDCYNQTTDHIFAVEALKSVEEVYKYNHRSGYPNVLTFEL